MKKLKIKLFLFRLTAFVVMSLFGLATSNASDELSPKATSSNIFLQQGITITGKITTPDNEPLPGVNITILGTDIGAISDLNGNYSITVPGKESVLRFSFIGYLSEEITVGEQSEINIQMVEDITKLNEVVVTAFGIKREEKSLGYAVSSISAEDITLTGATDFASALIGKAAGVRVDAANGGASSAVNIQIRGVTSIFGNTQPLYVVDGIPIRNQALLNTKYASNDASFWDEQRVRENGILDIAPENIESLTVLKGASASALYGSQAANGVVVITTKQGSSLKKGLGVEVNFQYNFERLAFQPDFQNTYGPGLNRALNLSETGSEDGWVTEADGTVRPFYDVAHQFGPKFDGRDVTYWDGSIVPYSAKKDNYKDFFDEGYNATTNVAITNGSDQGSYRFSYTRIDYKGIMPGSEMNKNNMNFNGNLKLNDKVSINLVSTYTNSYTHNRPYMMNRLFTSYSGFFSRMDDMNIYRDKSQTSAGYKWVPYDDPYNNEERLKYPINAVNLLEYNWNQLKNSYDEYQNRFINSVTLNIELTSKLTFRGRMGNDFTSVRTEKKEHNTVPSAIATSGFYEVQNGNYNLLYGDLFLNYKEQLTSDLGLNFALGYTGKKDVYNDAKSNTNGGLIIENWFNLSNSANSFNQGNVQATQANEAYQAAFGILDISYKDFLFLQGTARYEATSTLPPGANSYFYPSFNGSFVFSELISLPAFINYGKLRGGWGIVGNHPPIYKASVAYGIGTIYANQGSVVYQYPSSSEYGNDQIKSEKKYETEIGLEFSMLQNRLGVDISYYNNVIHDQIMPFETASSSGATSLYSNVGKLGNQGLEIAINANIIRTADFRWDMRINYAKNKNKLIELMEGVPFLTNYNLDGGSLLIRAAEGEPLGDIYVHPALSDANGNKVVSENGRYTLDNENYEKVGTVMPTAVGGFSNTFSYKRFALDIVLDYKFGGSLISPGMYYMYGAGMFESTMEYRDAEHGGLSYNIDNEGNKVLDANGSYHDGIILDGVDADGNPNTTVVDAATYYIYSYYWGTSLGSLYEKAVNKNSYIKLREVAISYGLPNNITSKIGFQTIRLSLVGRNLAYLWKTLPNNWDPECATGASWLYQGIDQSAAAPTRSLGFAIRASF